MDTANETPPGPIHTDQAPACGLGFEWVLVARLLHLSRRRNREQRPSHRGGFGSRALLVVMILLPLGSPRPALTAPGDLLASFAGHTYGIAMNPGGSEFDAAVVVRFLAIIGPGLGAAEDEIVLTIPPAASPPCATGSCR
ncbi:MAG: hypothetical protein GY937_25670 [bacterium]|nr:hypothetical protein [bacterium]